MEICGRNISVPNSICMVESQHEENVKFLGIIFRIFFISHKTIINYFFADHDVLNL